MKTLIQLGSAKRVFKDLAEDDYIYYVTADEPKVKRLRIRSTENLDFSIASKQRGFIRFKCYRSEQLAEAIKEVNEDKHFVTLLLPGKSHQCISTNAIPPTFYFANETEARKCLK